MSEISRILVVANPMAPSGVRKHVLNVLKLLSRYGIEVLLYIPIITIQQYSKSEILPVLKELEQAKIIFIQDNIYDLIEKESNSLTQFKYFIKSHFYNPNIDLKYLKKLSINNYKNINLIYDMHENIDYLKVSYSLAKLFKTFIVKLFHDEPFRFSLGRGYRKFMGVEGFIYDLSSWFFYTIDRMFYKKVLSEGILRGVIAVSEAPLYLSRFREFSKEYKIKIQVLKPANAYDSNIEKYICNYKEDYAVYFARLVPQKGIREIPKIAKLLKDYKILVFGKFFRESEKRLFLKSIPKNVEYMGFVSEEELYKYVSKSKVLLYPSHQDGFSLVVLESLALRTPVVAYDIPAINSVYGNLPPVKIVKEFDIPNFSRTSLKFLNMSDEEIFSLFENPITREFLELHSSWEKVAEVTLSFLNDIFRDKK
ncbi:MAG: glycosyltransferase family 4 protein [Sulfolobaceae archaeon]